jgi:diaminopimelate epimerase
VLTGFDPTDRRLFYKMTGSGNDFVFVDGRYQTLADWPVDRIRAVSDRRRGVGADGVVLLTPGPDAVRMVYFNADGSRAEMCGNAALCSARLADRLGIAGRDHIVLDTDAGRLECRLVGPGAMAELRFPPTPTPAAIELALLPGERRAFHGTVGVPHTIIVVDDVERVDVIGRGRALRSAARFGPAGTNVNFVSRTDGDAVYSIRTYERGVEDETLACGTGTVAAALALARAGQAELPVRLKSRSGSLFSVAAVLGPDAASEVWLAGEGLLVYTGLLDS